MTRTPTLDYLAAAEANGASGHTGPGADQCACDGCYYRCYCPLCYHPEETPCTA